MRRANRPGPIIGVVGATGMVGQELLASLERRRFPVSLLRPFSSGASRKSVRFRGQNLLAPAPSLPALKLCSLVFFVSADDVSRRLAPPLAKAGIWVIDDSAAFRLDPEVPLVIPEINADQLSPNRRLIAGPNCTMTGLAVAGHALHRAAGIQEARLASYQAVSGAGRAAVEEFFAQDKSQRNNLALVQGASPVLPVLSSRVLTRAIAYNVIPQVGSFDSAGHSTEERKVAAELRKIWKAPALRVSVTAVRVPVVRGHSLAAWLTMGKPLSLPRVRQILTQTPGLTLFKNGGYPTPLECGGRDGVYAGRLRAGTSPRELSLWIVSDNLLKGAALNSIQIAEELLRRRWLA